MPSRRLPTVQARLARLEEMVVGLTAYVTDGQGSYRLARALGPRGQVEQLIKGLEDIAGEADLREAQAAED
jgi:hypothetical protein